MKVKQLFFALVATIFAACTSEKEQISKTEDGFQVFGEILIDGKPADLSRASGSWSGLGKYKGDQSASVSYSAPEGYTVTRVYETPTKNSSNTSSLTFSIDYTDHTVYADVKSTPRYTNTVTAGTGGTATGTYTGTTGTSHEINAKPNSGFKFSKWTVSGGATVTNASSANTTATIGSSNGTIRAEFNKNFKIDNYLFCGNSGTTAKIYYKGKTYTTDNVQGWEAITYGQGAYVVVGDGYYSHDPAGMYWTPVEFQSTPRQPKDICYSENPHYLFVVVGSNGFLAYSNNGYKWTEGTINGGSWQSNTGHWKSICVGNGLFVAAGTGAGTHSGKIAYSNDGKKWTEKSVGSYYLYSVCYGNGKYVAVGERGYIYTSNNGVDWTQSNTGIEDLNSVCYGNGKFVAVGAKGKVVYSENGTSWNKLNLNGISENLLTVYFYYDFFVCTTNNGKILSSSDGVNWSEELTLPFSITDCYRDALKIPGID